LTAVTTEFGRGIPPAAQRAEGAYGGTRGIRAVAVKFVPRRQEQAVGIEDIGQRDGAVPIGIFGQVT
jgi:hypothetical protein